MVLRIGLAGPDVERPASELFRQGKWGPLAVNLMARLAWAALFLVAAPLGVVRLFADPARRPAAVILAFTVIYHVVLSCPVAGYDRYRLAIDPVLFSLAAIGMVDPGSNNGR